jgi:hypothetical protein
VLGHQWWGGKKGVRVLRSCDSDAFSWLLASVLVLLHFFGSGFWKSLDSFVKMKLFFRFCC